MSFGGGIALDEDWDLELDGTGDIKLVTEEDELQKDVAFNVARNTTQFIGSPLTPSTKKSLQSEVYQSIIDDVRIDEVLSLSLREIDDGFRVVTEVNASTGEFELVFEVTE